MIISDNFYHIKFNIRFSTTIKTRQYLYRVHKNNPAISYTFSDHCNMGLYNTIFIFPWYIIRIIIRRNA